MSGAGEGSRRAARFDDALKAVAEDDPEGLLAVLPPTAWIDASGGLQPLDRELGRSAVRADLLGQVGGVVVHGEYVKDRRGTLALRMVEYRAQIRRRYPQARIVQFVLVLDDAVTIPDHYDDPDGLMFVRWLVVRSADLDREQLLARPATAALATLPAGTLAERARALTAAVQLIVRLDPSQSRRLVGAAAAVASIHLPRPIIETSLQEASMPVPIRDLPLARELLAEGRAEGRAEGEHTRAVRMLGAYLRLRFGDDVRIEAAAESLAGIADDEAMNRIAGARSVDDLLT